MEEILSWKIHGKWAKVKVVEIEDILKKVIELLYPRTAYHESRTRSSDNSISLGLLQ